MEAKDELTLAINLATRAHAGQTDLQDQPYIFHPLRVMLAVPLKLAPAAVLHDVLEDTDLTAEDLALRGMHPRTVELVEILTRRGGELYREFIFRVARDRDAAKIKRADIQDNLGRVGALEPGLASRMRIRYERALAALGG